MVDILMQSLIKRKKTLVEEAKEKEGTDQMDTLQGELELVESELNEVKAELMGKGNMKNWIQKLYL